MNERTTLLSIAKLCTLFFLLNSNEIHAQRSTDISMWNWFQVYKNLGNKSYVSFQYQARFNNQISTFNSANYYAVIGKNFKNHLNIEAVLQMNTNHKRDSYTSYLGVTKRWNYKRFFFYIRPSVQYTRSFFTGDYSIDRPLNELRTRFKIRYAFNKHFLLAGFTEPYIAFSALRPTYFERVRNGLQFDFQYNKYNTFTLFYLFQPDVISFSNLSTSQVLGLTYRIVIPKKWKKLFKYKPEKKEEGDVPSKGGLDNF